MMGKGLWAWVMAWVFIMAGEAQALLGVQGKPHDLKQYAEKDAGVLARDAALAFVACVKKDPQGLYIVSAHPALKDVYSQIVFLFQEDPSLDLSRARFVLDVQEEGLEASHPLSSAFFMEVYLLGPLRAHDPRRAPKDLLSMEARALEGQKIHGALVGIGGASPTKDKDGHVTLKGGRLGLLETDQGTDFFVNARPPSAAYRSEVSHRYKALARLMAQGEVTGSFDCNVPERVRGLGWQAFASADHIFVVATGEDKAPVLARLLGRALQGDFGCAPLAHHTRVTWFVDQGAAWELGLEDAGHLDKTALQQQRAQEALPAALPQDQRILILSPHPDDDVISMGVTLKRLLERGNDVRVVYAVTGTNAVSEALASYVAMAGRLKAAGAFPSQEALSLEAKARVREEEAREAVGVLGVRRDQLHFLRAQYYDRRGVPGLSPLSSQDLASMEEVLLAHKPDVIYFAAENDPNGAHGLSTQLLSHALARLVDAGLMQVPLLYGYRGAYSEWPLESGERLVIVPFDARAQDTKTRAIKAHVSQLDPLYPSFDPRPFYARAKDRNASTLQSLETLCARPFTDAASHGPCVGAEAFKLFPYEAFIIQYADPSLVRQRAPSKRGA
ncbi:MAG: PIG-L family deacetylase [Proteobacteria bacterium]|nr:PIG-L family deacetylase [Pseudomonadota bacterium]